MLLKPITITSDDGLSRKIWEYVVRLREDAIDVSLLYFYVQNREIEDFPFVTDYSLSFSKNITGPFGLHDLSKVPIPQYVKNMISIKIEGLIRIVP